MKAYRWLVPKQYPLETSKECRELLARGYVLINNMGYSVWLDDNGYQYIENRNRKKPYQFSKPYLWQVLDTERDRMTMINTKSFMFRLQTAIEKVANYIL